MIKIALQDFLEEVKRFNEEAFYMLQIPVNIKASVSLDENVCIDRVFAICPIKETLYTENFDGDNLDCLTDVPFSRISNISEQELAQILMQLKCNMFELSVADYEAHYDCKVTEVETKTKQLMMTVAVEVECDKNFDIDELTIDEISFSNPEVKDIHSVTTDIIEDVTLEDDDYDDDDEEEYR